MIFSYKGIPLLKYLFLKKIYKNVILMINVIGRYQAGCPFIFYVNRRLNIFDDP